MGCVKTRKAVVMFNQGVVVECVDPTRLCRSVYTFWINDRMGVVLDEYRFEARTTPRHGWKCSKRWGRLFRRDNTMDKPSVPLSVKIEAIEKARGLIQWADENSK